MDPEQCHNSKYFPHLVEQHTRLSNKANIFSKYCNTTKMHGGINSWSPLVSWRGYEFARLCVRGF